MDGFWVLPASGKGSRRTQTQVFQYTEEKHCGNRTEDWREAGRVTWQIPGTTTSQTSIRCRSDCHSPYPYLQCLRQSQAPKSLAIRILLQHRHAPVKALPDEVTQKEWREVFSPVRTSMKMGEAATALASVPFCCFTVMPGAFLYLKCIFLLSVSISVKEAFKSVTYNMMMKSLRVPVCIFYSLSKELKIQSLCTSHLSPMAMWGWESSKRQ